MIRSTFIFAMLCFAGFLSAQGDLLPTLERVIDTLELETVEIREASLRSGSIGTEGEGYGEKQLTEDFTGSVADLLADQAGIFVRQNGPGTLATSSIRGSSASQSSVLWNGLPLSSPQLGLLDLSLLPTTAAEEVYFEKGGNAALWGSGAIGGVLALNNVANFSKHLNINNQFSIGQFGYLSNASQISFGNGNEKFAFQSSTKYQYNVAENNFSQFIAEGLPERIQENARVEQHNFLQNIYLRINKKDKLAFHYWKQISARQIPANILQAQSKVHQNDRADRLIASWKHVEEILAIDVRTGWIKESIDFYDDLINFHAPSGFTTWMGDASATYYIGTEHAIVAGASYFNTTATATGYRDENPTENKLASFLSYRFIKQKFNSQISLREEWIDGQAVPLIPNLGLEYQIGNLVFLNASLSRKYRNPTLNDRFWRPGGNINLLPESGWSQELGAKLKLHQKGHQLEFGITGFSRKIDNWILWSRPEGQLFWSSNNITKVWSRGLESRFQYIYEKQDWTLQISTGYDFIKSTNQIALELPKLSQGQQLWYTPEHQAHARLSLRWKHLRLHYTHTYTGATLGFNENPEASQIGIVRLNVHQPFGEKYFGSLFLIINNLWDVDYFFVERKPMPERNIRIGINLKFKN